MNLRNELYHRELSWIELISNALHVFAENFGAFLRVIVVVFLPICLLESAIMDRVISATVGLQQFSAAASISTGDVSQVLELSKYLLLNYGLLFMVSLFLQPVGVIAIAKMVKQSLDGEPVSAKQAILEAFTKMPAILVSGLIFGVLVAVLSIPIIPGIYFGILWGLYQYVICFEDRSGWAALQGSKRLIKGRWWRTLGVLWLLSAMAMLWNSVFSVTCSLLGDNTAANLLYDFLCYFSVAFVTVGETMLYLNRKAMMDGIPVKVDADQPAEPVEGVVEGDMTEEKAENPAETPIGLDEKKDESEKNV